MNQHFFAAIRSTCIVLIMLTGFSGGRSPKTIQSALAPATFYVTKTDDTKDGSCDADCSLREAVISANASASEATIQIPNGIYILAIAGEDDNGQTGDLDIKASMTIQGGGATTTIIDGGGLDRIFQINTSRLHVILSGMTLRNGHAEQGGAIKNNANLSVIDCILTNNVAGVYSQGGAIMSEWPGILSISGSTIANNQAGWGGGIFNSSIVTITNSTFRDNVAGMVGGGLSNRGGTVTIAGSTFSSNHGGTGGGISSTSLEGLATSSMTLMNSTISGNTAGHQGGGIENNGDASLNNVTVTNNTSSMTACSGGGGVYSIGNVKNSIIAGNFDSCSYGPDCIGILASEGYNLIGNPAGCTIEGTTTGNIYYVMPLLGSLQNNGGPTLTHSISAISPARDAGSPLTPGTGAGACEATDQRGISRPINGRCDIGAYETTIYSVFLPTIIKNP